MIQASGVDRMGTDVRGGQDGYSCRGGQGGYRHKRWTGWIQAAGMDRNVKELKGRKSINQVSVPIYMRKTMAFLDILRDFPPISCQ